MVVRRAGGCRLLDFFLEMTPLFSPNPIALSVWGEGKGVLLSVDNQCVNACCATEGHPVFSISLLLASKSSPFGL